MRYYATHYLKITPGAYLHTYIYIVNYLRDTIYFKEHKALSPKSRHLSSQLSYEYILMKDLIMSHEYIYERFAFTASRITHTSFTTIAIYIARRYLFYHFPNNARDTRLRYRPPPELPDTLALHYFELSPQASNAMLFMI